MGTGCGMNLSRMVRAILNGVFWVVKFTILSILRLGRWCWDKIHLK